MKSLIKKRNKIQTKRELIMSFSYSVFFRDSRMKFPAVVVKAMVNISEINIIIISSYIISDFIFVLCFY